MKWKTVLCCLLVLLGSTTALAQSPPASGLQPQALLDVPDVAQREIDRRGDFVERIDGYRNDVTDLIAEALEPPADDSYKWFITVVTTRNCRYCEALKQAFTTSPDLRPFVDVNDHAKSWAHYNVFSADDQTQRWRWEGIRLTGYPTLLVQPPRNGRYGDPKTIVLQKTGFDGDAKKLAATIRSTIMAYVARFPRQPYRGRAGRQAGGVGQVNEPDQQQPRGYEPPFSPPPRVEPAPYAPLPFDVPPAPQPQQPSFNPLSLLAGMLGSLLCSGGMTNLLLLVLAAFALIRTFRKATGQKLLLDDEAYQNVVDTLKKLIDPQTPKTPNANP